MEQSAQYGFNLPSRDNPEDMADINAISENFRKADDIINDLDDRIGSLALEVASVDSYSRELGERIDNFDFSIFANSITAKKSGKMVALRDVAPFQQELKVRVDSVSSDVSILKSGKNLVNIEDASGINMDKGDDGSFTQNIADTRENLQISLLAYSGNQYIKQLFAPTDVFETGKFYCSFKIDGTFDNITFGHNGSSKNIRCKIPLPMLPNGKYSFSTLLTNVTKGNYSWKDIQIEPGEIATEYEKYIEPIEYLVNQDGTVNGVTSIYPTTVLYDDIDSGSNIEVEYIADTKKYIDEKLMYLEQMIQSASTLEGGE